MVLYTLNEADVEQIRQLVPRVNSAAQQNLNEPNAGDQYTAVVVRCWPTSSAVNLKVLLDGGSGAELWATSRTVGTGPGTWQHQA